MKTKQPNQRPHTKADTDSRNGLECASEASSKGIPSSERLLSASYQFLTIANNMTDERETLAQFVDAIKKVTYCDAVGIRILDGDDCLTYGAEDGFCEEFMATEGKLSVLNDNCLCTLVFNQQTNSTYPFFTPGGSFYTNNAKELLKLPELRVLGELRGTCFKLGYQTIALFPVCAHNTILGLIHIADLRPEKLPPQMILLIEKAALQLGTSIEKTRALDALKSSHEELEWRVFERTAELVEANQQLREEIEQRKAADDRLMQHKKMLQRVFNGISDPLVLLDLNMKVQMMNSAAKEYYGVDKPADALNKPCYEGLGNFRSTCQDCRIQTAVKQGHHMEFERQGFRQANRNEEVVVYPLNNSKGKPQGAVLQIHDVTELKAMKQQLDQIESQASLGMLVSSVAHEIKNPNTFISFNISILRDYLADMLPILDQHADQHSEVEIGNIPYAEFREEVIKIVDTIELGTRRIDKFLGNLREFSTSKSEIEIQCVPLSLIFEKVLSLTRTKILQSVNTFDSDIPADLPKINTDPVVLEQVLINLLVNAAQAVDKSTSWIRLRMLPLDTPNDPIVIQVEDNGCGMDALTQKQLFEPFYSTKIAEGGTGLGLYVCRNLVHQLGGRLNVTSELGQGACFTIELPSHENGCEAPEKETKEVESTDDHRKNLPLPTSQSDITHEE